MTATRILLITGPSAVGKSTLGSMLAKLLGVRMVNSGDLLRAYLWTQDIVLNNELDTGRVFLGRFGESMAGEVISQGTRDAEASIVDGVRLFSSLEAFARHGSDASVILLSASLEVRKARFVSGSAGIDASTSAGLDQSDVLARKAVWDADLPEFERVARWKYANEGTLDELAGFACLIAAEMK